MEKRKFGYIVESSRVVTKVEILRSTRQSSLVRFSNGGGIRVSNSRIFPSAEAAAESVKAQKKTPVLPKKDGA